MKTLGQIITAISRKQPVCALGLLEDCELPLLYLGKGAYRKVYEIVGSDCVVKVPMTEEDIPHARVEYKFWRKIMRSKSRYKGLHPYMPMIHYFNKVSGIVVMQKYSTEFDGRKRRSEMNRIESIVNIVFDLFESDFGAEKWDNYGVDRDGNLRIIDLGYLSEEGY